MGEDLYSTVSQSDQTPPGESCETGERRGDGGGGREGGGGSRGRVLVVVVGASPMTSS